MRAVQRTLTRLRCCLPACHASGTAGLLATYLTAAAPPSRAAQQTLLVYQIFATVTVGLPFSSRLPATCCSIHHSTVGPASHIPATTTYLPFLPQICFPFCLRSPITASYGYARCRAATSYTGRRFSPGMVRLPSRHLFARLTCAHTSASFSLPPARRRPLHHRTILTRWRTHRFLPASAHRGTASRLAPQQTACIRALPPAATATVHHDSATLRALWYCRCRILHRLQMISYRTRSPSRALPSPVSLRPPLLYSCLCLRTCLACLPRCRCAAHSLWSPLCSGYRFIPNLARCTCPVTADTARCLACCISRRS